MYGAMIWSFVHLLLLLFVLSFYIHSGEKCTLCTVALELEFISAIFKNIFS